LKKIEKKVRKIDIEFRKYKKKRRKIQAKNKHLGHPKNVCSFPFKKIKIRDHPEKRLHNNL